MNLLHINAQNQSKFCEYMTEHHPGITLYFPTFVRVTRPAKKRHPITETRPVYPGYIFCDHDRFVQAQTPYHVHFIRFGGIIASVPPRVIAELKRLESLNKLVVPTLQENPYYPGRRILVHTPLFDIRAIIIGLSKNQIIADTRLGTISVPRHKIELL